MPAVENVPQHGTILGAPLEIKILKSGILHAREDKKNRPQDQIFINLGPLIADVSGDNQRANFNTLGHMGPPGPYGHPHLKNQNLETRFCAC